MSTKSQSPNFIDETNARIPFRAKEIRLAYCPYLCTAIWKAIMNSEKDGYPGTSVQNKGYRL